VAIPSPRLPPRLDHQGPTLATLHMVERLLRRAEVPLSLNKIKQQLPRKVMHATLRNAIEHYKRLGCVVEGSKGVMWVRQDDPEFWRTVDSWDRW
jgi:hypothetical protein